MANPRKVAASVLTKIQKDAAYSNITLGAYLKETELSNEDKKLASRLVYGVLDRKITLDWVLSRFIKTPIKKTAPFTLQVLRCALYQIMFMDKIPDSAAVNEAVKLIKNSKDSRNAGFVNAVLRAVLRENIALPKGNSVMDLSVRYSCSEWIIDSLLKDYETSDTVAFLEASLNAPPLTIRTNTTKISTDSLIDMLDAECDKGEAQDSLNLKGGFDVAGNELFKKGYFYIQDSASQKAVSVLNPQKGMRVLDVCAAPGGKSFLVAILMENEGEIISCDLYEHKISLIRESAKRLGLNIIKPTLNDARKKNDDLGEFDAVLCDVPCSGLGVIRRKPEIKYKPMEDFKELEKIQFEILENAAGYLKKGGKLLYSTCTLRKAENEKQVEKFLQKHSEFIKKYEHTYMPHIDKTDGFYCALIEKV